MPFTLTQKCLYNPNSGLVPVQFQMLCSSLEEILSTRGKSNAAFGDLVSFGDLDLWEKTLEQFGSILYISFVKNREIWEYHILAERA